MSKISVIGAGGWGTAMAIMLSRYGHDVTMWSKFPEEIERLSLDREHVKLLNGVKFPEGLKLTTNIECVAGCNIVIIAVPSFAVRETARILKGVVTDKQIVVNIGKGLEPDTLLRLSQVIEQELCPKRFAVMSGPSHAEEVARGIPTTNVISSNDRSVAEYVQDSFMNPLFRIYTNDDMIGVELGAALKNVIAISAGISDGMGYGDNTKAALMTRGITEIARLGVAMGAKKETFAGLSGIGDLIVTCTSMHSRNRRAGILIGSGVPVQEALKQVNMVVEGYTTSKAAYNLAKKIDVDMPITIEAYKVLYENKDPRQAMSDLMLRQKKNEVEETWLSSQKI